MKAKKTPKPDDSKDPSEPVVVYTTLGREAAAVIKGRLESEGIPAMLRYESIGPVYGIAMDGLGQVEILVPRKFEEKARAILEEGES
ncbi:MAG: DUF2007 domain-containing protein [Chloroflexi bacterium]|nr:DUF2007 domain-containing protein [Chloroflexota bacterium]